MKTTMKRIRAAAAKAAVALAFALFAATTAQAAANWTGNSSGNIRTKGNYQSNNNTWSMYINSDNLTGNKRTSLWIDQNTTTFKLGDSKAVYKAMQFQKGNNWEFHSNVDGNPSAVFSFDNSGGSDSSNDKDRICVAAAWDGGATAGDAALRVYAIDLKTKYLYVGSSSYSKTGTLTINKHSSYDSKYVTKFTTTDKMYLHKGSMTIADSTVISGANMELHNFTATVNSGTLTANGDIIIGVNAGNSATFTQNGGTVTLPNNKWTKAAKGNGTLNLNGGTFTARHITDESAGSSLTVNFNGGTLKANAAHSDGLLYHRSGNGLTVNVGENGGTIDTGAYNIKVAVPINAVENTAGSFTVKGGGSATFTGAVNLGGGLNVTGGGTATFSAMGDLAGALTVGDNTTLHWFDQDGAVSATPGFTSLALGAGATVYLDGDATGVDAHPATVTTTATTENKANVAINFSVIPATGSTYTLFPAASADVFNVQPSYAGIPLPCELAVVDGNLVLTIVAEDYTWNGTGTNWGDADAWTKGGAAATWTDGNNAIFNTANATATLAANASPAKIDFSADATVDGEATLTVPSVSVAQGVTATVSAPMAGALEKTGAGTLALGANRTGQTTVTEGTLKVLSGATVAPAKLTLGTDAAKPVALDCDGETLSTDLSAAANRYMAPGMDVTLTNGVFESTANPGFNGAAAPAVLTIAKDAVFRSTARYTWNASQDASADSETTVNIAGGQMVSDENGNNANWFMQNSRRGTLRFNVTDGGLFQTGSETYIMTCRDSTTAADTPEMYMMFSNSTFRVANNKNLRIGYDANNKNPLEPKFSLAMTNSVLDVGTGIIYLGHNVVGENTAGSYTADFVDSVISAKCFKVYHDRPANSARFDNSTIVLAGTDNWSIETQSGFGQSSTPITIGAGGLTIDTQAFTGQLQADPQGKEGAIAKKGTGILRIMRDQTASAPFVCEEGETYLSDGHSMARAVTVKNGATFTVNASNTTAVASIALEAGAELRFDKFRERQAPLLVGALTLPAEGKATLTFGGTPLEAKAYELLTITNAQTLAAADIAKLALPAGYENYSLELSSDGKTLYIVGGSSLVWTGAGADTAWTTDANWLNGSAPDGTVDPSFLEGLIAGSGSRTVTFDDESIARYVYVDGGTAANPIVFAKADGGAGRLVIDNNYLIVGQKSSEAALTIAPGMQVEAKVVRVGGLASSVSRLTVQGSLHTTSHVCVGSNGAEGEVTGIIDIDGGAVTNDTNDLVVGDFAGPSSANYSVVIRNGGEYNSLSTAGIRVSAGADGTIAITNGTLRAENGNVNMSGTGAGRGTLILGPGALVVTKRVTSKDSTSTGHKVVFDGGTLKAVADDEYFIDMRPNSGVARVEVEVGTGGGTIDTAGKKVSFFTIASGVGGLAVTGGGELTFNNKYGNHAVSAFDYEGATAVAAGTAIRSGADVTTFAGDLTLASGAMVNVGLVSSVVPCLEAGDIAIASGAKIVLDAAAFPAGTYPILRKTGGGAFTAGDLANLALDASAAAGLGDFTRLALGGTDNDSICLVVDHAIVPVMGRVVSGGEPVTLTGNDVLVGAGGLDIGTLKIPDNGRLVFDPVKTPVYVYSQDSGKYLTFGSGAKLALTPNYAGMTLGRIVLLGYKPDYVDGLPENLDDIFDASTIAPGATYTITSEPIPEKETYARYLVLTVGDYENDAKEIRLTCIGDSITQGTGSDPSAQYRTRIAARLAANGYKPKMLGIWKKNYREATNLVQPEDWSWHSGISGDMIMTYGTRGGVRDNLHVYLDAAGNVDALTLLIGTNDIGSGGKTGEETYIAYTNLLFDIARLRPATKIVGSTILDRNGDGNKAKIAAFNALLKADYAAGLLPANYTMLDLFEDVPLTTGETGNFFDDLLHPNWVGCSAIAEGFAAGIMNALPFATYAGTIETEATDEPEAALGAAGIAATVEGAGLAAYTNGMSHIFTIETTAANNSLYGSSPYTEIVTPAGLDRNVKKAGYFMELVRKGTRHHRYVWVDFDATGKTLDEIDFPWNGDNLDFVAEKLHVFSNDGSIHNVAADDDTVTGAIEGTYWNYSGGDDSETVPDDIVANNCGWDDTLGSTGGYGGFQAHRIFGEGEHWHGAEVLFAWNGWGSKKTSSNDEIGIGTFFYSEALGGDNSGKSADYTWISEATSDGAADTLSAAGYQVVRLEIWAELEGLPRHGFWSGASGDFDDPKNWEDGQVPVAGDNLDFSLLTASATVNANVDAAFGAVTMGDQRVTFTNDYMKAASFSDMSKVEVGENSTVTITEDYTQTPLSGTENPVYSIGAGGKLVFAGTFALGSGANGGLNPQASVGGGVFVVNRIENNADGRWIYVMRDGSYQKWVVGPGGIGGTTATGGLWLYSNTKASAEFQANTNDFEVALPITFRTDADYLTFNTTGWGDGEPHKITLSSGIYNNGAPLNISGTGKVVANFYGSANYAGYAPYSGEVKVNDTATLAINPGKRLTTGATTFAAGTTLEVTPVASGDAALLGTLAFTGSGTVTLKAAGDATLADGEYTLFTASSALADDILSKFTLDASAVSGGKDAWIFRNGASIKLCIGTRTEYPYGVWMGGMDANFSSPANWKNGLQPRTGDTLDFSSVGSAKTVNVDIDNAVFGKVTMGSGVVTFTGTLTATQFSDTSKVAVGANSTVTLDGDLVFSGTTKQYVVNTVAAGGRFVVTGYIEASAGLTNGEIFHSVKASAGAVQAKGLKANEATADQWIFRLGPEVDGTANWIVGADGLAGVKYFYVNANASRKATIQPLDSDFSIATCLGNRSTLTLNTTGFDGNAHKITIAAPGYISRDGPIVVAGTGTLVADGDGASTSTGAVTVQDTATLAIKAGKQITTGAIAMNSGTTLALPQTGTVTMGGNLTLAAGTTIAYTLSAAGQTTLDLTGKTFTLPAAEADPVAISLEARPGKAVRSKTPYTLISGANLTEDDLAKFTLGANPPEWVASENALVIEDGDLKLYTKNPGLCIMIK